MAALVVRSSDEKSLLSSIFQPEKISTARGSGGGGPSSRSSRKNKNGPKKQPQRGLGVAQLEKLRIQEENKQDAACLASLGLVHLPTSYESLLARQIKGASFQIFRGPGPDRNGGNVSAGFLQLPHQDFHAEVFKGLGAAAASTSSSPPQSSSPGFALEKNAGIFMAMRGGSSPSPSPEMIIKQQHQQQEMKLNSCNKAPVAGVVPGESSFGINCVQQLFDSSHPPGPLPVPRDCRELPLVGIPKELSSFQTKFTGNQVWQPMHNASKRLVLQENPRVLISLDHSGEVHSQNNSETTTEEHPLKATAHYTPRTISNALCTTFLKPEVSISNSYKSNNKVTPGMLSGGKADPPTEVFVTTRKRASPLHPDSSPPPKKPATSGSASSTSSDFLALSLSIFHPDTAIQQQQQPQSSGNDSGSPLQRSLSSLQEASSGLSEEVVVGGYGGGGGGFVVAAAANLSSSCSSSSGNSSEVVVDLSLKLAI